MKPIFKYVRDKVFSLVIILILVVLSSFILYGVICLDASIMQPWIDNVGHPYNLSIKIPYYSLLTLMSVAGVLWGFFLGLCLCFMWVPDQDVIETIRKEMEL
jgi:hypothetical protein